MSVTVCVGRLGRAHGVRGEVSVEVRTDEPERRFTDGVRLAVSGARAGLPESVTVVGSRWHSGRLLLRLADFADRTAAETLSGALLHAEVDDAESPADPEEFYDHQLVGLRVEDTTGRPVGSVTEVRHQGAQDLLVVDATPYDGPAELLVPFVTALVPTVDLAQGLILVEDRPGLLDPTQLDPARLDATPLDPTAD